MPSKDEKPGRPLPDLDALLEALVRPGVEFILVGGLAAVAQGTPITTVDVDIVHRRTDENIDLLFELLKSLDARHRRPDDKVIFVRRRDLTGPGQSLLLRSLGPLDVLGAIEEGRDFEVLLKDSVEIRFRGGNLRVLSLETLVSLKRGSKDPKDLQRLPVLEQTLREIKNPTTNP